MIMKMADQWAWTMMIFRCLILLLLTFNIQSKIIDYTFTVDGSDLTFTDLSANYESQNYLRSSIWKLFIENDSDNKFQKCWNNYLTNKKITYSISGTTLSMESINNNSVTYKYTFDLNKIKGLYPEIHNYFISNKKDENEVEIPNSSPLATNSDLFKTTKTIDLSK